MGSGACGRDCLVTMVAAVTTGQHENVDRMQELAEMAGEVVMGEQGN